MRCEKCQKDSLIIQYEVSQKAKTKINLVENFDSLELAEDFYENVKQEWKDLDWRIKEIKICNECDYIESKVLIVEEV